MRLAYSSPHHASMMNLYELTDEAMLIFSLTPAGKFIHSADQNCDAGVTNSQLILNMFKVTNFLQTFLTALSRFFFLCSLKNISIGGTIERSQEAGLTRIFDGFRQILIKET